MTKANLDAVKKLDDSLAVNGFQRGDDEQDAAVVFPTGVGDELIQATLDLTETVGEVQGNPLPALTWAYVNRKPKIRRATRIKEEYIMTELRNAVKRLSEEDINKREVVVKSAVDHLVRREKELAAKDGREPAYFSRVMIDEVWFTSFSSFSSS
jgi:hypothetical protein